MGHVDHGKTTLLDYIRKTNIAEREAGGITQSIGAYEIIHAPHESRTDADSTPTDAKKLPGESSSNQRESAHNKITFIDTPGHEAFSKMRAHSARIADLAILIVAADDGVKLQTKDALRYIAEEKIPFIVAINKIDKPSADIEKTKNDISKAGVFLEGYGGDVSWHAISAKTGEGVEELLDLVTLAADIQDLSYNPSAMPTGFILTSKRDARKGILAGIVLTNGILKTGEVIATESAKGKIKTITASAGENVSSLIPSSPALILGFENMPRVGEIFFAGEKSQETCKKIGEIKFHIENNDQRAVGEKQMALVVKADEFGSLEAVVGIIQKLSPAIRIKIVSCGIGNIYEGDVKTADSAHGAVLGFKVKADKAALNMAKSQKVVLIQSNIIYELEKALKLYAQKISPKELRTLEILAIFGVSKGKEKIIGGRVALGPIKNQESFEIWQNEKMIGTGKILNLQSQRKDIHEAETDTEIGLLVESEEPIKIGNRLVFSE